MNKHKPNIVFNKRLSYLQRFIVSLLIIFNNNNDGRQNSHHNRLDSYAGLLNNENNETKNDNC